MRKAYLQGRTKKNGVSNVSRSGSDDGISEEGKDRDGRTDARKISESRIAYSACGRCFGLGRRRSCYKSSYSKRSNWSDGGGDDEEQQGGAATCYPCR